MTKPSRNMTIRRSTVLLGEAPRFRRQINLADTGQPKVLANLVMIARSFMTPARKPRPSSELTVLPEKRGKEKAIAPLPEEEKEKDLKEVEEAVNDATKEVEGMRNETNFLIKQYGKKEEKWVEKSEANTLQRKELDQLEQHATETGAAIEKAKAEIVSFTLQLKDQEAAIAAKNRAGA